MDVVVVVTSNSNIIIIVVFIIILVILGLIIWVIVIMVPKNNVPLFGVCTHQIDCSAGLVCSQSSNITATGTVCLNGLAQTCNMDSDCASSLVCLANTDNIKVCMVKTNPPTTLNTMSNLVFDQSLQNVTFTGTNVQPLQFTPKMQPITQVQLNRNIAPAQFNTYNQNRIQVSPLMDIEKKKLTRYL